MECKSFVPSSFIKSPEGSPSSTSSSWSSSSSTLSPSPWNLPTHWKACLGASMAGWTDLKLKRDTTQNQVEFVSIVRVALSFLNPDFDSPVNNAAANDLLVVSTTTTNGCIEQLLPSSVDLSKSFRLVVSESSAFLAASCCSGTASDDKLTPSTAIVFSDVGAEVYVHKWALSNSIKLCVVVDEDDDGEQGRFDMYYSTKHFDEEIIATMADTISHLLNNVNKTPPTSSSSLLTVPTRTQLLQWSCPQPELPDYLPRLMHASFLKHASQQPNKLAVVYGDSSMTYGFMHEESNRIAKLLQSLGVGPDVRVGLLVDRSCYIALCQLSVLRAGGAFVTIGIDHPRDRVLDIISDASIHVLLSVSSMRKRLETLNLCSNVEVVYVDLDSRLSELDGENDVVSDVAVTNLAYLIYTSGTTGRPKGVMIEHQNFSAFAASCAHRLKFHDDDVFSCLLEYTFDVNVGDTWLCFHVGGRLVVFDRNLVLSMPSVCELIQQEKISWLSFTPTHLYLFLEHVVANHVIFPHLRLIHVVGEALNHQALRPWMLAREQFGSTTIMNGYGPSETTVVSSCEFITNVSQCDAAKGSCIGTALPLYRLYVVNRDGMLVPPGVAGELWIGGPGVGRGYLNRSELTAEKFIANPFDPNDKCKLYKSGDLCSWNSDGSLVFHCRIDHQVKLRGYRIELDEIANAIRKVPGVKQAVVCLKSPHDNAHLVGYVTPGDIDPEAVLVGCRARLPPYMVPSGIMAFDKFPLSSNGKVNRNALPDLNLNTIFSEEAPPGPVTQFQEELIKCIASELMLPETSVDLRKSFMEHGGNSLSAVRVGFKLRKAGFEIAPFTLAHCAALTQLELLATTSSDDHAARNEIPKSKLRAQANGVVEKPLVCSFTQQHYLTWREIIHGLDEQLNLYHCFKISGPFDLVSFQRSMKELVNRHEIFRTTFLSSKPFEFKQIIHQPLHWDLVIDQKTYFGHEQESETALAGNASQVLDIMTHEPLRVVVHQVADQVYHALIVLHHSNHDGFSENLLNDELWRLYDHFRTCDLDQCAPSFPVVVPSIQYYDYADWQHQQYASGNWTHHEMYWKDRWRDAKPLVLPYKVGYAAQVAIQKPVEARVTFEVSAQQIKKLRHKAQQKGVTLYCVVLSLMKMALATFCGQPDISVVSVVACRNQSNADKCFGVFANDVLLHTKIDLNRGFEQILHAVARTVNGMLAHHAFPYLLAMKSAGFWYPNPLEKCYFVYQEGLIVPMSRSPELKIETVQLTTQAEPQAELYIEVGDDMDGSGRFTGSVAYDVRLFDQVQIEALVQCFTSLGAWVADSEWYHLAQVTPKLGATCA